MKKSLILSLAFAFTFSISNTFCQQVKLSKRIFKQGQLDMHANLGVLPSFPADNEKTILPPLTIGSDLLVSNNFSVGLSIGHSISNSEKNLIEDGIYEQYKTSYTELGLKFGLHITRFDNIDIVSGLALNYAFISKDPLYDGLEEYMMSTGIEEQSNNFIPGAFIGLNYAVSKKFTVRSEFGIGISIFKIGVGYRLK